MFVHDHLSIIAILSHKVSRDSTLKETVCDCVNLIQNNDNATMTVGTTFYVPYNKMDFKAEADVERPLGRGPVIGIVIAVGVIYSLFLFWAWREDQKDKYKVYIG